MKLQHRFSVPVPVDQAWETFNDLEGVAPCFPGATLTSVDGDEFSGSCKVRLGPISMQYGGTGRFVERNPTAYTAVIEARGKDKRGNGTAAATVTARLSPENETSTAVEVVTNLTITGKPAQFGRGVMQDVGDKLLGQFATCLESRLAVEPEPEVEPEATTEAGDGVDSAAPPTAPAARPGASDTPLADAAAASVGSPAASVGSSATSVGSSAARVGSAPGAESEREGEPELDLGATVLPVIAKRYAPYAAAVVLALFVLGKLIGRVVCRDRR